MVKMWTKYPRSLFRVFSSSFAVQKIMSYLSFKAFQAFWLGENNANVLARHPTGQAVGCFHEGPRASLSDDVDVGCHR